MSDRTIIAVEPAVLAFGAGKGARVKTVEVVLYDDGTTEHRCTDCGYTSPKFASVFAHRGRKHPNLTEQGEVQQAIRVITKATAEAPNRTEVRALERKVNRLEARLRDERKARRKAESDLTRIRTALGAKA